MDDAVRISAERFRLVYKESFETWAQIYARVVEKPGLPPRAFVVQDDFQQCPVLPRNLKLKADQRGALATGYSIWNPNGTNCDHKLSPFRQPVHIRVAVKHPVLLSISESSEGHSTNSLCFTRDCDYLAVLVLAWTYILSARWTEIMPGTCSLAYTESQAASCQGMAPFTGDEGPISIDLGELDPEEARWWAAILAQRQGWQAEMTYEKQTYISPWSIHLQQNPRFVLLRRMDNISSPHPAATFSDASHYLNRFCTRFDITDQSLAALASVLLLPSMGGLKSIKLPAPRTSRVDATNAPSSASNDELRQDWIFNHHHLDKLLTLSCNTRGMRPLLLSPFYEPSIECNAVTPWLQGTLAAFKHVAENNSYIIGRICMERSPKVAFLWLGCIILDLQDKLLQGIRFGQIPIDLHSAAWSGTVQSFLQQRVSNPLVADGYVSRKDESRLLFLSQSDRHARLPVCQWRPFGKTPVEDVDIEVRVHQQCQDHWLQYEGTGWECMNGEFVFNSSHEADSLDISDISLTQDNSNTSLMAICYGGLDREREAISENATRSIFGWLRSDGFAQHEREIWEHEWFEEDEEDDEDSSEDEGTTGGSRMPPSRIKSWLSDLYPFVDNFSISL